MRLGQRFESARRLLASPIDKPNTRYKRSVQSAIGGFSTSPVHQRGTRGKSTRRIKTCVAASNPTSAQRDASLTAVRYGIISGVGKWGDTCQKNQELRLQPNPKEYSANFACYDFCAVSSLRGSLTGHLIGRLSCGKKLPASHLAGPFLGSVGGM